MEVVHNHKLDVVHKMEQMEVVHKMEQMDAVHKMEQMEVVHKMEQMEVVPTSVLHVTNEDTKVQDYFLPQGTMEVVHEMEVVHRQRRQDFDFVQCWGRWGRCGHWGRRGIWEPRLWERRGRWGRWGVYCLIDFDLHKAV